MRKSLVTVSFAFVLAQMPAQVWIQNPATGHYYALTSVMSWTQAEQEAQQYGGHLATVRNAGENAWLASTFATGSMCLWIGLNDVQNEGSFVWSSGEPVTYLNWAAPTEPSNGDGLEDWAHLTLPWGGSAYDAAWNDGPDSANVYGWPARGIMEVGGQIPAASYTPFGAGCLDPFGAVPVLAGAPGEVPRPGTTSHVRVSNLPATLTLAGFVVGFSTTWDPAGYPLPLDLGVVGWPGCPQLISFGWCDFVATQTGSADYAITVPANYVPGFTFYVQSLVLYFPSGTATSNAVTGVVGY